MSDLSTESQTNPAPSTHAELNEEIIGPEDWVALARTKSSKFARNRVMKLYATANGFDNPQQLVEALRSKKISVYPSAKKFTDSLDGKSPNTKSSYRSLIKPFLDACVGEDSYKKTVFDRLVPADSVYNLKSKKIPTMEQVRYMVSLATPQYPALIGCLLSGTRIGEIVSRRWRDLEPSGRFCVGVDGNPDMIQLRERKRKSEVQSSDSFSGIFAE